MRIFKEFFKARRNKRFTIDDLKQEFLPSYERQYAVEGAIHGVCFRNPTSVPAFTSREQIVERLKTAFNNVTDDKVDYLLKGYWFNLGGGEQARFVPNTNKKRPNLIHYDHYPGPQHAYP